MARDGPSPPPLGSASSSSTAPSALCENRTSVAAAHETSSFVPPIPTSVQVVGIEYRLAPEHPWPAQLEDAVAACRGLTDSPLIVAGDSAGGHLAVKTAHQIDASALVLLSPWVDFEMPGRSFVDNDSYDFGTREVLLRHAHAVASELALSALALDRDPLAHLPACFVSVGGVETPRDDIVAFAEKLRAQGVECELHVAEDMPHDPAIFESYHPSGRAAFDAAAAFIRRHAEVAPDRKAAASAVRCPA